MICSKKKNKAMFYRRLKGMTQQNAADILKTGKSNVANMESEKFGPSEGYQKLLNLTPRELNAPLLSMESVLDGKNIIHHSVSPSNYPKNPFGHERKKVFETLENPSFQKNISYLPKIAGEINGTDIFVLKSEFEIPELSIKKGDIFLVMPKLCYNDGTVVLYRKTRSKLSIATVCENGTELLSLTDENSRPDICSVEIIGEIITK